MLSRMIRRLSTIDHVWESELRGKPVLTWAFLTLSLISPRQSKFISAQLSDKKTNKQNLNLLSWRLRCFRCAYYFNQDSASY